LNSGADAKQRKRRWTCRPIVILSASVLRVKGGRTQRSAINEPWPVEEDISQAIYEAPPLFPRLLPAQPSKISRPLPPPRTTRPNPF